MALNLNQFKIKSVKKNAFKSAYFFLLRITQETELLFKTLGFLLVLLKPSEQKRSFIDKEDTFIWLASFNLASFNLASLSSLKNYCFKKLRFLNEDTGQIYGTSKETLFFMLLSTLNALLKGISLECLGAQRRSQKKELPTEFKLKEEIARRVSKWESSKQKKSKLFSFFKKRIFVCPLFLVKGKKELLGFFIAFFPFFISSNDRYQNLNSEKNLSQKKKTRLSNKEKNFEKISYEEIGLFPRSFSRVFDRFVKQLFNDVENLVLQEYRFYRYLFLTTVKCFFILLLVPFLVNLLAKNYLVRPLTEYLWNTKQSEIFLNAYQQKHAFSELKYFEEKLYFESLVFPSPSMAGAGHRGPKTVKQTFPISLSFPLNPEFSTNGLTPLQVQEETTLEKSLLASHFSPSSTDESSPISSGYELGELESKRHPRQEERRVLKESRSELGSNIKERKKTRIAALQLKTVELAINYNNQSIEAITNFFADLLSVITFFFLLVAMEIPINISKSFLLEVFFGLDDSKKSLLILLVTDLLVGYHSDGPWAIFFESLFNHYGLPESQTGIFLLVATLPVLLDVLFKYLIFRHLNRASPATVATYHAMIE